MSEPLESIVALPTLPPRSADSHKGTYGRVLVLAGSRGMSGAAVLSASAALRSGAGLVGVGVPASIAPIVASMNPCYTTFAFPEDDEGRFTFADSPRAQGLAQAWDVVALGPGLGRGGRLREGVADFLSTCGKPIVLDADGLNACIGVGFQRRAGPTIITPHPGEFARQLGVERIDPNKRSDLAARFALEQGVIVVLKGHRTIVTDGRRLYENTTGNPGMSTGGTGDVLTGVIAALWGQKLTAFDAAQLGAFVHGRAGDLARDDLGAVSLTASDLLDYLPKAFLSLRRSAAFLAPRKL